MKTVNAYASILGNWQAFVCSAPTTWQPPRETKWLLRPSAKHHPLQFTAYDKTDRPVGTGTAPIGNREAILQDLLLQWQATHFLFELRPELSGQEPPRRYDLLTGWEPSREDEAALSDIEPSEHTHDTREAIPAF